MMPNFTVDIRASYRDMTGLVLDLRSEDLLSDEGAHDGANNAAVLTDSSKAWTTDALVGKVVKNIADNSCGRITANTATTITAVLAGGTDNDWDAGDEYSVQAETTGVLTWPNRAPAARIARPEYDGAHDGPNNSATLIDSTAPWRPGALVGLAVWNMTDNSYGWITANTDSVVTAALAGGAGNDWDAGDVYRIRQPAFGNPYQTDPAKQPTVRTVSGRRLLEFRRAAGTELEIPAVGGFPTPDSWWSAAVETWKGASVANNQFLLNIAGYLVMLRRNAGGNYEVYHASASAVGAGDHPDGLWLLQSDPIAAEVNYWLEGVVDLNAAALAFAVLPAALAGYIGSGGGGDYLDGRIRSMQIWNRPLAPIEVDFAFQTLAADGDDHSIENRAAVAMTVWTDETGDYSRVRSQSAARPRFALVTVDGVARLQIAAAVAGKVRPDSELGGDLFSLSVIEVPGTMTPAVVQDAGWSAVFDVRLDDSYPGHYAFLLSRANGGGVILHFDVEAA